MATIKRKPNVWWFTLFLLIGLNKKSVAQADTAYIRTLPYTTFFSGLLSNHNHNISFNNTNGPTTSNVAYTGNLPAKQGFYVGYRNITLSLKLRSPRINNAQKQGTSTFLNVGLSLNKPKYQFGLWLQNLKGVYDLQSENYLPNWTQNTPSYQRPDVQATSLYATYMRIFNHQKYSYRAPHRFTDIQTKSAGSVLLTARLGTYSITADSALIPHWVSQHYNPSAQTVRQISIIGLGVIPGYGYNLVILKQRLCLGLAIGLGPELQLRRFYKENQTQPFTVRPEIAPALDLAFALAYNSKIKRFFTGLSFEGQFINIEYDQMIHSATQYSANIFLGWRFNLPHKLEAAMPKMNPLAPLTNRHHTSVNLENKKP